MESKGESNLIDQYERRLRELPHVDKALEKELRDLQILVEEQDTQRQLNSLCIEGIKTELAKLVDKVDEKDNQIQGLQESGEKTIAKEKKYIQQIQVLTKKIDLAKQQIQKKSKDIENYKKQVRTLQGQVAMSNAQKSKVLQVLTRKQIKHNKLIQTATALKLKRLQPVTKSDAPRLQDNKREQKQVVDLFHTLKKQMELIDVLKRQKSHLVASSVFKYCQGDFSKLLQMNNRV